MSKLFTKIGVFSVGLALAIGTGVAIKEKAPLKASAGEVVTYTLDGTTTGGSSGYAVESDITQNSISWKVKANTTQNPWRFGGNSLSNEERTAYSTKSIDETITKVEVEIGTMNVTSFNSLKLIVSSAADFAQASIVKEIQKASPSANSTQTFESSEEWTNCYYKLVFNITVSGTSNKYVQMKAAKFYKESSAVLQSIQLSESTISGYVVGNTFNKASFTASGVKVTAKYDGADDVDVTSDVDVESVTLADGNNNVEISYGGKTANLVVQAKTQDAYDAEAAEAVDDLIDLIDFTESGSDFVTPFNTALTAYRQLNDNAKSKVTKYSSLENFILGNENYIIFNNALASDSGTDIFKDGVKGTVPSSWLVPSSVDFSNGSAVYDGADSRLKIGKSGAPGSITISLNDNSHVFTALQISLSKYGTDDGTASVSGIGDELAIPYESEIVDISSEKLSSITISNSSKRVYIDYIYFEETQNVDTLDSNISSTGTLLKTSYVEGQSFDPSGLTFSVSYNGGHNSKVVTDIEWEPDPLTAGTTSVIGTYTEGEQHATITINGLTVAQYVPVSFGKVGQSLANYAGDYFFYNVNSEKIWDPRTPAANNSSIDAEVSEYELTSSVLLDVGKVTIAKVDGGYTLRNSDGKYVGPNTSGLSSGVVNPNVFDEGVVHEIVGVGDDGIVTISATYGEETTVYLRFNSTSGQMRARYYTDNTKVAGFILFKSGATPAPSNFDLLDEFVNDFMHPEISYSNNEDTNSCRSEGDGAQGWYDAAAAAFNALDAELRELFATNSRYANPKARLLAWAEANGQALDTTTYELGSNGHNLGILTNDKSVALIISVIVCVSALAFVSLLAMKKRRFHR